MAKYPKLTDEEKKDMEPKLRSTWHAIGDDAEELIPRSGPKRLISIMELVTDANCPLSFGFFNKEQDQRLSECYHSPDTQKWLRSIFRNY